MGDFFVYNTFLQMFYMLQFFDFFVISSFIVIGGMLGLFFLHTNLVVIFMCLEVVLVTLAFNFVISSCFFFGSLGFIFGYLLLIVAGAESAIALSVLTSYFFVEQNIFLDYVIRLKG